MKLATYLDGSRDGQLVVVSRDLTLAHYATSICNTMQQLLDDWNFLSPQLQDLYDALNRASGQTAGTARHAFPFEASRCAAPLPRIYQWATSSQASGAKIYQRQGGDAVLAALDIEQDQHFALLTEGVPAKATPAQLRDGIRLVVQLYRSDTGVTFDAVAATPDEYATSTSSTAS